MLIRLIARLSLALWLPGLFLVYGECGDADAQPAMLMERPEMSHVKLHPRRTMPKPENVRHGYFRLFHFLDCAEILTVSGEARGPIMGL